MFCVVYKLIFAVLMMSDSRQFGTYRASFWSKNSHQLEFLSPLELKNRGFATLFGLNVAFICFKQSFYTNASRKYQLNLSVFTLFRSKNLAIFTAVISD